MDFIVDFIYGILWISHEIHLIWYERPGESEESHLNQLFLLISSGFYEICQISFDFMWNPPDFMWFHVKSAGFHDERPLASNSNAYVIIFEKTYKFYKWT